MRVRVGRQSLRDGDGRLTVKAAFVLAFVLLASPVHAQDTPFTIASASYLTLAVADVSTSAYVFGHTPHATEALLGHGLESKPVAFGVLKGSCVALALIATAKLHQSHPKTALWIVIAGNLLEGAMVARTARMVR